jgi:type 1 glutamine amidotransferase
LKTALIVWGGLELHEPEEGAMVVAAMLAEEGFSVDTTGDYAALGAADLGRYDLVMPQITGGELSREHSIAFAAAIVAGTGLAAFHHGIATTFPGNVRMRFMGGCTFAGHPGDVITYHVDPVATDDPVMAGIGRFEHTSEQYYLHVDPTVTVLATTTFSGEHAFWKKGAAIPQVYKSAFGKGRVFYTAFGHKPAELEKPEIRTILRRGMLWAAR